MSLLTLLLRNLKYYRKSWLSILAGTVISTAVLTGALVVGDSVRYSLDQLTDIRLGKTRFAVQSGDRFFRQKLAGELGERTKSPVSAVLQLDGIALNTDKNTQINKVEVLGIDDVFMKLWNASPPLPAENEAILSRNTAEKLLLQPGDEFLLKLRKQARASANAPFVSEQEPLVVLRLKVAAVADDYQMGRFSLKSNQSAPFNIFVSLKAMARKVELTGSANLLLVADNDNASLNARKLDSLLRLSWQAEDAGLGFRKLSRPNNFEIRSGRIFIDANTAGAIRKSIPGAKPVLTYLVNAISVTGKSTPYSFVTARDSTFRGQRLSDREIVVSNWLAADLSAKPGDSLSMRYFKMGPLRKLTEDSARFCIKAIVPIADPIFDRTLMPDFPGMSGTGNCRDWETGAPVDLKKIRDKDEQYWNDYRGTPKAIISIAAGEKLWNNAFGLATAYRFTADSSGLQTIENKLMQSLVPAENGFLFRDVYSEGKAAASNSTDFGGLFLSLSFFLIAAALLLTGLLFSLQARKRMAETAILATLGFHKKDIIRILFIEALLVVVAGSFMGILAGIFYNKFLLFGLNTLWQDAVRTSLLLMHLVPATLMLGFVAGVLTALLTLLYLLLRNMRKPLSAMVKGLEMPPVAVNRKSKNISLVTALSFFGLAVATILYSFLASLSDPAEAFLSAGGMILVSGIAWLNSALLGAGLKTTDTGSGFFRLVLKNVILKRRRTVTAVALLALGTFSVIITGANRKTFYGSENLNFSGTGGFLFWAESTVPLLDDLHSPQGKEKYGLADEPDLKQVQFSQMLRLEGNDASCLNLNQVSQPAMLGINASYFDRRQSFSFIKLDASVDEQHPWLALNTALAPGIIPGFADQTVIQWGLRKKIGDTLLYRDESGKILKVKLMGGLDNSIFQGNILVSATLFGQYFPSAAGSAAMLVDGDDAVPSAVSERLEYLFQDYGMVVTPASERLAQFNSVENTYLSVFMLLGGLGILIGTIGLGIVLLRNVEERKQEIAIYQAIGFKHAFILKLVFAENLFILLSGIGIGLLAAFAGILPSFFSPAFQLPATFLLVIILMVLLSGMAWIYFPLKSALRKDLIKGLRKE
jgi:ABC-type antimicrobial peptide transport system permease subunit